MVFLIFILTIIINKIKSDCSSHSSCESCNFYSNCKYTNNICTTTDNNKISNYLNQFQNCYSDTESKKINSKYCGDLNYIFQKKKIKIQLPKINNKYGKDYLICSYTILNNYEYSEYFYLEIKKKNDLYSIIIESINYNSEIEPSFYYVETGTSLLEIQKLKGIIIHYLSEKSFEKQPFEITIKLNKNDIEAKAIIIVCIIIIIIIIALLIVLIILYKKRDYIRMNVIMNNNREREEEINLNKKNKKLCENFVNSMTPILFKDIKKNAINTSCNFCLTEFNLNDEVYIGNCNHVFHFDEIKQWLFSNETYHNTCPECRNEIIKLYQKGDNINEPLESPIRVSQINNNNNNNITNFNTVSNIYSNNNYVTNNNIPNENMRNNRYMMPNNSSVIPMTPNNNNEENNENDENAENALHMRENN